MSPETEAQKLFKDYHYANATANSEMLKWFNFWLICQSWHEAGKVEIGTVKILADDKGYDQRKARFIVNFIEQRYRSRKHGN